MRTRDNRVLTAEEQDLLDRLGILFYNLRQEAGISQYTAAELGNTTQARISYLENGYSDMKMTTLQRLGAIYGYRVEFELVPLNPDNADNEATDEGA